MHGDPTRRRRGLPAPALGPKRASGRGRAGAVSRRALLLVLRRRRAAFVPARRVRLDAALELAPLSAPSGEPDPGQEAALPACAALPPGRARAGGEGREGGSVDRPGSPGQLGAAAGGAGGGAAAGP